MFHILIGFLSKTGLIVFLKIEMEFRGLLVDGDNLESMEGILLHEMNIVEQDCFRAAGKTFQVNSSTQVSNILYKELKLDTKSNIKIKETLCKGAKSTSEPMVTLL